MTAHEPRCVEMKRRGAEAVAKQLAGKSSRERLMDWDVMNLLFDRGWIHDPKSKAKSVVVTEEGFRCAEQFLQRHFASKSK